MFDIFIIAMADGRSMCSVGGCILLKACTVQYFYFIALLVHSNSFNESYVRHKLHN